jgi:hypothetical protein
MYAALREGGRADGRGKRLSDRTVAYIAPSTAHHSRISPQRDAAGVKPSDCGGQYDAVCAWGIPNHSLLQRVADIADVIGRHLDVPVVSIDPDDAAEHFGWLATFFATDVPASSGLTRELLGWHPMQPTLIEDLDKGHYFDSTATSINIG